ncbi:T7SS effector LXG polymorphic toxin [Sporosarcina sp. NPDC096371]|uniref:T7SS effector LXG polymorphic toxin n=1 Tax=Sporosarcina sp. NPDC096371 TaxID=3364530 RepID=UPI0038047DE8
MKILDVHPFQDGLRRNIAMLDRLGNEMRLIQRSIEGLVAMEDSLTGEGGHAIRAFYAECHLPFFQFFMMFKDRYTTVLKQMELALDALEPDPSGYIREHFLEVEIEQGLQSIARLTESLTDEANSIMNEVADIVGLPHLDDSEVQYGVRNATIKRNDTIMQLYEFDTTQVAALTPIGQDLQIMERWLEDIEGIFRVGLTDIHFKSDQWSAISHNSGLKTAIEQQNNPPVGCIGNDVPDELIGTEITPETFLALAGKRKETVERGIYGNYNLLKFHVYENGLIIKEYQLGTSKPIQYEVVKEVEEEFDDGGARELDSYFEETPLAFVDYINPKTYLKKGAKKMVLAFLPGAKPSKYKGEIYVKKDTTVEDVSKGTGNGMDNGNKKTSQPRTAEQIISDRTKGLDINPHPIQQKQLSAKKMKELRGKIENRTITKAEYEQYIWNKKFAKHRASGVTDFWYQERQRILNNETPTRDWNQEQINDILNGKKPKVDGEIVQGHHSYSASQYPHLANKGEIIYPATPNEHFKGWHGGNWKNSLPGKPINPIDDY